MPLESSQAQLFYGISHSAVYKDVTVHSGMKITKKFCLSSGKVSKNLLVHHYSCLSTSVPDTTNSENRQNSSRSFGKVPKIFACPPLFLHIPDRRTVSKFHPCAFAPRASGNSNILPFAGYHTLNIWFLAHFSGQFREVPCHHGISCRCKFFCSMEPTKT